MSKSYYIEAVCMGCKKIRTINKYMYRDLCVSCAAQKSRNDPAWRKNHSEKLKGRPSLKKGIPLSEEHKRKLSESHKGIHISPNTEFKKGQPAHNRKTLCEPIIIAMYKGKMSTSEIGRIFNVNTNTINQRLKKHSVQLRDSKEILRQRGLQQVGEKSPNWKGGITEVGQMIRRSHKYQLIRKEVLQRDNYKCVLCNSTTNICVDHIKRFADHLELRCDKNNMRVLCKECHIKTPTYSNKRQEGFVITI